MNFRDLTQRAKIFYPAIYIDRLMSITLRRKIRKVLGIIFIATLFLILVPLLPIKLIDAFPRHIQSHFLTYLALASISFGLFLKVCLVEWYYRSHYFSEEIHDEELHVTYEVATVVFNTKDDVTKDFMTSSIGVYSLLRCNISQEKINSYFATKTTKIDLEKLEVSFPTPLVDLAWYGAFICKIDESFSDFLFKSGIPQDDFLSVLNWIQRSANESRIQDQWWSKENISRVQSLGKDWDFGKVFELEKYGYELGDNTQTRDLAERGSLFAYEIDRLENSLLREKKSNTLIIGETNDIGLQIVAALQKDIMNGKSHPSLRSSKIYVLEPQTVVDSFPNKAGFENEMITIFNEAVHAGNIILVIDNFPSIIEAAHRIDSDIISLIGKFLQFSGLQVIAISDTEHFHATLEPNMTIMSYFEKLVLKEEGKETMLRIIQNEAERLEDRYGMFFTYPALVSIIDSSRRYFNDNNVLDKSLDILEEIIPVVRKKKRRLIIKSDILDFIKNLTGIPMGEVSENERATLLNLETLLHKRVVGQSVALKAISESIKRARAGIINSNRPMGSFLFLGPTGVGKTESAKALAEAFFGNEDSILRLDMSEFASSDALERLTGSFQTGKAGILSNLLRDKPYGVLLLDEFEKTNGDVLNLFLQILDEGFFSDMTGKKVNARNLIIIATSNAGSELIIESINKGSVVDKQEVINSIISKNIFKAELLNRFDGVILFESLTISLLKNVVELQIGKLQKRLEAKGIRLHSSDDLVEYILSLSSQDSFGARTTNRIIQEKIESLIATEIINGTIHSGCDISFVKNTDADYKINPFSIKVLT